jgi:chemotaxis family two-component system response regulator Rcp1
MATATEPMRDVARTRPHDAARVRSYRPPELKVPFLVFKMRTRTPALDCDAYLAAHQRAYIWVERAMMHRSAGNFSKAETAMAKVQHWLREIKLLEDCERNGRSAVHASHEAYRTDRRGDPCLSLRLGSNRSVDTARSQILSPVQVLLVEDSPGDVRLTQEAFDDANANVELHVATDGVEAMDFLRREGKHNDAPRPDLVILDLNLPRLDGREVLARVKEDSTLKAIPIVVLSTSASEVDIAASYHLHANCYFTKPVDLDDFDDLVQRINAFWIEKVKTPRRHVAPDA